MKRLILSAAAVMAVSAPIMAMAAEGPVLETESACATVDGSNGVSTGSTTSYSGGAFYRLGAGIPAINCDAGEVLYPGAILHVYGARGPNTVARNLTLALNGVDVGTWDTRWTANSTAYKRELFSYTLNETVPRWSINLRGIDGQVSGVDWFTTDTAAQVIPPPPPPPSPSPSPVAPSPSPSPPPPPPPSPSPSPAAPSPSPTTAEPSPTPAAPSPSPSPTATVEPSPAVPASPSPTAAPSPTETAAPSPSATVAASPSPTAGGEASLPPFDPSSSPYPSYSPSPIPPEVASPSPSEVAPGPYSGGYNNVAATGYWDDSFIQDISSMIFVAAAVIFGVGMLGYWTKLAMRGGDDVLND